MKARHGKSRQERRKFSRTQIAPAAANPKL